MINMFKFDPQGDKVYICDGGRWIEGVVIKILGPLSYLVKTSNGFKVKRHIDHMRSRIVASTAFTDDTYYCPYNNSSTTSCDPPLQQEQVAEGSQSTGLVRRSTQVSCHPNRYY